MFFYYLIKHIYIYIIKYIIKYTVFRCIYYLSLWVKNHRTFDTLVEGDSKVSFSIATTSMFSGGRYSIPWIAPLYPWSLLHNAECIKYHFLSIWYDSTWDWTAVSPTIGEHSTHLANRQYYLLELHFCHLSVYTWTCTYIYINQSIHTHLHLHFYASVSITHYAHIMHTHMCAYIPSYIYIYIRACVYISFECW